MNQQPAIPATPTTSGIRPNVTATSTKSEDAKQDYSDYHCSPPRGKRAVSFSLAIQKIADDDLSNMLKGDGDTAKMLVFLYGRGFLTKNSKDDRVKRVKEMISPDQVNENQKSPKTILLNLIAADGDKEMSENHECRKAHTRHRVSIARYFQQEVHLVFSMICQNLSTSPGCKTVATVSSWPHLQPCPALGRSMESKKSSTPWMLASTLLCLHR
jgi:hypothetical protein